ncbi:MAG: type II toxin-antitoxin system VapC family toxin [bacterium]|nr:type II toxin-antitoxin system VapC family toxin [bacterium]
MRILDSDHCVALLRGTLTLEGRVTRTEEGTPAEALAITSITVGELVLGAYKSANRERNLARLDVLLAGLNVLPFDGY